VRVQRLGLQGFGRFLNFDLELGPGLNLIYGLNEAGKTTLLKFILGMLYGFKKSGGQGKEYTEDQERFKPWAGDEYRGTMVYQLENGSTYRVERNFQPNRESIRIFDLSNGREVTRQFPRDRRGEVLFAVDQLGIPVETFVSTAWVGQLEVSRVELARELLHRVANLQESGREDLSVRRVLAILEDGLREIGTEKTPTRPYGRLATLIAEKKRDLARASGIRGETLRFEARLRAHREEAARLEKQIQEAQRLLDWAMLLEVRHRLERVEEMAGDLAATHAKMADHAQWAEFSAQVRDRLIRLEAGAESARAECERLDRRLEELERRRDGLLKEMEPLRRLDGLGGEVGGEAAAAFQSHRQLEPRLASLREEGKRLRQLVLKLQETMEPLTPAVDRADEITQRLEELDRQGAALRPKAEPPELGALRADAQAKERKARRGDGWTWLGLAALFGYGAAALFFEPILTFGYSVTALIQALTGVAPLVPTAVAGTGTALTAGAFVAARVRQARRQAEWRVAKETYEAARLTASAYADELRRLEQEKDQLLQEVGATTAGELRGRLVRYDQLRVRYEEQSARLAEVTAELDRLEQEQVENRRAVQRIVAVWHGVEPADAAVTEQAVAGFQQALNRLQALRTRLEVLERELEELTRRREEEGARLAKAEADRQQALEAAGVTAMKEFEEGVKGHGAYSRLKAEADRLEAVLKEYLGSESLEALEDRVHKLAARAEGEQPAEVPDIVRAQQRLRGMEKQQAELMAAMSDLTARIETTQRDMPDLAELAREAALLEEEKEAMSREMAALELARQVISQASGEVHREFAPELNRKMSGVVTMLTGGRYKEVKVDERTGLRVLASDDRLVDVRHLSSGTIDQFYMGLRFALIDLLTRSGEKVPLILDDPFVQYDEGRLVTSMQFLAEQSQRYQVILCTCHDREVRLARDLAAKGACQLQVVQLSQTNGGGGA
jgi:DNA repair exonuclease SbcCD ATPase subunit